MNDYLFSSRIYSTPGRVPIRKTDRHRRGDTSFFKLSALSICLYGLCANAWAEDAKLATVVVQGEQQSEQSEAQTTLKKVAGATALIDNAKIEQGRDANAEDLLALQPGIFAQSTSGTTGNKISIRGSGLGVFYGGNSLGIKYLYDGLPVTGVAGTHEDQLNLVGVDYTEVLYGGNAFAYTATSLGGAINWVSKTGYTAPGTTLKLEGGSYGYRRSELSTGGVSGNADYFFTAVADKRDGFQDNTRNHHEYYVGNFGYYFNEKLDTRFFFRYGQGALYNGGTLSLAQLKDDPSLGGAVSRRSARGTTVIGNKTTYKLDDVASLEFGLQYNSYPLEVSYNTATPSLWHYTDIGTSLRYLRKGDTLFGRPSETTVAFSDIRLVKGDAKYYSGFSGNRSYTEKARYNNSADTVLAIGNELEVVDDTWLITGLSLININREVSLPYRTQTDPSHDRESVDYDKWFAAPRLGFRYQLNPQVQLFGNVTRSVDGPAVWNYQGGSVGTRYVMPRKAQTGTTLELGLRAQHGIFDGSLSVYRSWIKDEILSTVIEQATQTQSAIIGWANASPTIHQGIEAGLNARLWEGDSGDVLSLRQALTLSRYYYRHDSEFGDNKLPGLPETLYQAELHYQQHQGFYASLNLRSSSSYYADYANTLKAPSYTILGAKMGYEAPSKRWSVYLDLRNLTDEKYVTAVSNSYDLQGVDSNVFYPGDGFSAYGGITYHF
ncbi:TonB-dependent receptor family protein [Pseudomonas sp. LRF_L74]|uniref:TonB-dependent receptor family protein n=1 Tax=Pseudomonas sp. LRF_L74 TaxID=3369422 RepID=UPI003F5DC830